MHLLELLLQEKRPDKKDPKPYSMISMVIYGGIWRDIEGHVGVHGIGWVLPSLCDSWMIFIIYLYLHIYIALNMTSNVDCYRVEAVPKVWVLGSG